MKTKILFFPAVIATLIIVSCNKIEPGLNSGVEAVEDNASFPQSNAILSFADEDAFLAEVENLRHGGDGNTTKTCVTSVENFISLYEEFSQAMAEADNYYQREGGYEEFKAMFPHLYYPEYEGDYSAFLPVSDESIAKLINQNGKVLIAGKEVDFRDVWSYDTIRELGLGMPQGTDNESLTKAFTDVVTLTLEKQNVNSKRKAWITLRGIAIDQIEFSGKVGRIDLCFRKKGFLGWYNGQMTSRSYVITGYAPAPSTEAYRAYYLGGPKITEYSPHKYCVAIRPLSATSSNFGAHTFYFECGEDDITYSFTGKFTTNVDALLNMNNGTGVGENLASAFTNRSVLEETFGPDIANMFVWAYQN